MAYDFALPSRFLPRAVRAQARSASSNSALGDGWSRNPDASPPTDLGPRVVPTPQLVAELAEILVDEGARALEILDPTRLTEAWCATVDAFLDPQSAERRALDPVLIPTTGLSSSGLEAGLQVVLGGVRGDAARRLFEEGRRRASEPGLVLIILASNLPALVVQPLLAALAVGRPTMVKSPSAEPFFAAAFVRALVARLPELGPALAALAWPGGESRIEAPLLSRAGRIIAYGEAATLDSLAARSTSPIVGYGPKTSLAIVSADDLTTDNGRSSLIQGLARDIALFDQRGCLSIGTVFVEGSDHETRGLGIDLAAELRRLVEVWPPGAAQPAVVSAVRLAREEADLLGGWQADLPIDVGTVLVEPRSDRPIFRPSPGLRTVRIQPLESLAAVPSILAPWQDGIQGIAWTERLARRENELRRALELLGVSRFAPPGRLQAVDTEWHNGGLHPLAALGALSASD